MASPQNLATLTTNITPVTNTSGATFAADYAKVSVPNISNRQRKALRVLMLLYENNSGIDYRTNHAGLIADAAVYMRGISNLDLNAGMTVADWSAGYGAYIATPGKSAAAGQDLAGLLIEAKDFTALPELTLDRMIVYLRVQMGV